MSSTVQRIWPHPDDLCTETFRAAQLWWGTKHTPVTILNLSSSDALIESALVPTPNASIYLTRGRISTEGRITWSKEGRLGVRFRSQISVPDWLAPTGAQAELHTSDLQITPLPTEPRVLSKFNRKAEQGVWKQELFQDLNLVKQLFEKTGDGLAANPRVMQEHIVELQSFDVIMQMLATVCSELNGNGNSSVGLVGREEIRRSCLAALEHRFH